MICYKKLAVLFVSLLTANTLYAANLARTNTQTRLRTSISTGGGNHTCQVMGDGSVQCWGLNDQGQLGVDNTRTSGNFRATPVTVPGLTGAVAVTRGLSSTCALLSTGF